MNNAGNIPNPLDFMKGKLLKFGLLGFAILVLLFAVFSVNSIRNEGIKQERRLSAQYLDNQNYLSAYISGFYEQVGVAKVKTDKLNQILLDAVKGRYDGKMAPGTGGAFFSAIAEAYPDLSALNVYDKIVDYVAAGREGYRNIQSKLLDMLQSYDAWRETGFWKGFVNGAVFGLPTERLEARIGSNKLSGDEARDKMYQIILAGDAVKAYEDGTLDPLEIPS